MHYYNPFIFNNKEILLIKKTFIKQNSNDTIFKHQWQEMKLQPDNKYRFVGVKLFWSWISGSGIIQIP